MITTKRHGELIKVERRRLTPEEEVWIRDIVHANPKWADANLGELFVAAECNCGCRSIMLEDPGHVQNPKLIGHQGLVGEIDIRIRFDTREDIVSVLQHYAEGSLSLLEVVWYNFPEPVPRKWTELSRDLRTGD
jgi:hypothetical protein